MITGGSLTHEVFRQINIRRNVFVKIRKYHFFLILVKKLKMEIQFERICIKDENPDQILSEKKSWPSFFPFRPVVCRTPDKPISFLRQCALSLSSGPQGSIHTLRVQVSQHPLRLRVNTHRS